MQHKLIGIIIAFATNIAVASIYINVGADFTHLGSKAAGAALPSKFKPAADIALGYNYNDSFAFELGYKFKARHAKDNVEFDEDKASKTLTHITTIDMKDLESYGTEYFYSKKIFMDSSSTDFRVKYNYKVLPGLDIFATLGVSYLKMDVDTGEIYGIMDKKVFEESGKDVDYHLREEDDVVNADSGNSIEVYGPNSTLVPTLGLGIAKNITDNLLVTAAFNGLLKSDIEVNNKNEDAKTELKKVKLPVPYSFKLGIQYQI